MALKTRTYARPPARKPLTAISAQRAQIAFDYRGKIVVNVGRICFKVRSRGHLSEAWQLEATSLDLSRTKLVNDLINFVEDLRTQYIDSSVYKRFTSVLNYVDWADREKLDPLNTEQGGTFHRWIDEVAWKNVRKGDWKEPYACGQLLNTANALAWTKDTTPDELLKGKSIPRRLRRFGQETESPDDLEYEKYLTACFDVFMSFNRADQLEASFPLRIESDLLRKPIEWWHGHRPFHSTRDRHLRDRERQLEKANRNPRQVRRLEAANLAAKAFIALLIAVTSLNVAQLLSLTMDGPTSWVRSGSGAFDFVAVKGRAGGRTVLFSVTSAFRKHVEQYLEVRKWLLGDEHSNDFIVMRNKAGRLIAMEAGRLVVFNKWIRKHFRVKHMTPRMLRKKKAARVLAKYKSPLLASWVLQNEPSTVERHYGEGDAQRAASEMTKFFKILRKFSADYKNKGRSEPKVSIVKASAKTVSLRSGGQCTDYRHPTKNSAFSKKAPDPDCSSPGACLFCAKFAMHADHKDVHRLLSFREFIHMVASKFDNAEHAARAWGAVLARIDSILKMLAMSAPGMQAVIAAVKVDIANGDLDPVWQNWANLVEV